MTGSAKQSISELLRHGLLRRFAPRNDDWSSPKTPNAVANIATALSQIGMFVSAP
jgi:hypothetical protein